MLYYADTMQAKAMKLMASKLAVAGIIEGTFSDEGLSAMSDVKDLTSQMAKELMLGIRDNVEDIAASFKRMAIINPNRQRPKVIPIAKPEKIEQPADPKVISVESEPKRILYEGLLEKSNMEIKRKSKRPAEVENQLSLFDFAA